MKEIFETEDGKGTERLGEYFGRNARAGDIFCLDGDLGTGKTVFAQGFAKGLEIRDIINSPTFTILSEHTDGRLPLYHFDVYRIGDPGEMDELGYEEYFYGDGVTIIEWASLIEELLPKEAVRIVLAKDPGKGFDYRKITVCDNREERNADSRN